MNLINIKIDGKNNVVRCPSSWHELTTDELTYILRLLSAERLLFIEEFENLPMKKLNIFMAFLQKSKLDAQLVTEWQTVRDSEDSEEKTSFLTELNTVINAATAFLFSTIRHQGKPVEVIAADLLRCPYPKLNVPTKQGVRTLYAPSCGKNSRSNEPIPSDSLQNITIYELGQTFSLYEQWAATPTEELLNTLIATLYRPKKADTKQNRATNYEGDVRLPLRGYEATLPQRRDLIARNIPAHIKEAIVFWFGCCRHHFAELYPDIFSTPNGKEENRFGYAGIILELSRTTGEGKNTIADQRAHSTMIELQYEQNRAKRQNTEGVSE
jgi:hypothetical protein